MKKICIITASRAEYGYFKPLIKRLINNPEIDFQLIASGAHLDKRYGYTITEIFNDGITPSKCIEIIDNDTPQGTLNTMANAVSKIGEALIELKPDIAVILGDRYEMLSIASACVILNIPIAHIAGGDVTYGAYDEMFRHAITKMSSIHFTSCELSRKRVIQMGEQPENVFNTGALSLENIKNTELMKKEDINKKLGIDIENTLSAVFHPVTMEREHQEYQFTEVLEALTVQNRYFVLFTRSNADTGAGALNKILDKYAAKYPDKIKIADSLGSYLYLSVMKYARGLIGNSSSGIIEAPSFHTPVINIGNRQKGRMQAKCVFNCPAEKDAVLKLIENLPSRYDLKDVKNPYEGENPSLVIMEEIIKYLNKGAVIKKFYELKA